MTITIEQLEKWMAAPSEDEQIHVVGRTSKARWFPGSGES
jgi:hypothetical protein